MLLDKAINDPEDSGYKAFRDHDDLQDQRNFIESLWQQYKSYADSNFKDQISRSFKDRFWEMYLGCSLLKLGFEISSKNFGPDIKTQIKSRRTWFEAVTPSPGNGDDAVIDLPSNISFPVTELILRFTSVIWDKYKILKDYINKGIVKSDDSYVIAINSSKIDLAASEGHPPHILKALFSLGHPIWSYDIEKRKVTDEAFAYKPIVLKKSGEKIETLYFENEKYCEISAILYSRATPFFKPIGWDYFLIHNPYALNPIPFGALKIGRETYTNNEYLNIKEW